jgi:hypothetical protein
MAGNHRFCTRCQSKHASPTGKKCRRPILEPVAEPVLEGAVGGDLPQQLESLDLGDNPGAAVGNLNNDFDRFDTLLSVVSDLASRVDATQRRLDNLQLSVPLPQATDTGALMPSPSSGAISKRPACTSGYSCAASADSQGSVPSLQDLRADPRAVAQATSMVDSMDTAIQGINNSNIRALRRGWSRPGGDNAPRVAVPWPQDFIIGHGKKARLCYDDLTVFEWTQGCLAIIEREEDIIIARGMLALLRATLRDAAYHGFEAARYSYGCILSMMEDGILHWGDTTRIAEERRSALIARGTQVVPAREAVPSSYPARRGFSAPKGGDSVKRNNPNYPNFPGGPVPRPCVYYNNGVCPQRGDHQNAGVLWKHVCRRCLDPAHTDKDCPLQSTGTGRP